MINPITCASMFAERSLPTFRVEDDETMADILFVSRAITFLSEQTAARVFLTIGDSKQVQ